MDYPRILVRHDNEWVFARYKMSQWRNWHGRNELWHLVEPDWHHGHYWVSERLSRCPHTELKNWLNHKICMSCGENMNRPAPMRCHQPKGHHGNS